MTTYNYLRAFADSWFLIGMFVFFSVVVVWVYWPTRRASTEEIALIPLGSEMPLREKYCANQSHKVENFDG